GGGGGGGGREGRGKRLGHAPRRPAKLNAVHGLVLFPRGPDSRRRFRFGRTRPPDYHGVYASRDRRATEAPSKPKGACRPHPQAGHPPPRPPLHATRWSLPPSLPAPASPFSPGSR